jgi:putative FmdB family regulatory protein
MPTYDYQCDACEHAFEEFQSMTEEPLKKCPKCGKKKLRRLIGTGAAILFKGSGFYQTDYRSESYKSAAKADDKAGTSSTSGTDASAKTTDTANGASADTKPAAKSPAKKAKT